MSIIKFKIELAPGAKQQLQQKIRSEGGKLLAARVMQFAGPIVNDIATMLGTQLNATPVIRALRGQGADDLAAHFGLSDTDASALADGMIDLIKKSVQLQPIIIGKETRIQLRAAPADWQQYLSLPGAQYISYPSNMTIPVAKWLLIDPNIDIGQAAYDIVFLGEYASAFDTNIQNVSRSGRAIMVALEQLGGAGGGYVLPAIVSGHFGGNFIEYALMQDSVRKYAAQILLKRVI